MREVVREAGIPFQTHSFTVESLRLSIDLEPELMQHPNVMSVPRAYASEAQKTAIREMIVEIREKGLYSGLMAIPNRDQVESYAARKGMTLADAERWLAPNLGYDPANADAA